MRKEEIIQELKEIVSNKYKSKKVIIEDWEGILDVVVYNVFSEEKHQIKEFIYSLYYEKYSKYDYPVGPILVTKEDTLEYYPEYIINLKQLSIVEVSNKNLYTNNEKFVEDYSLAA